MSSGLGRAFQTVVVVVAVGLVVAPVRAQAAEGAEAADAGPSTSLGVSGDGHLAEGSRDQVGPSSPAGASGARVEDLAAGADIAALSLDELLAQPIAVTSRTAEKAREAAGVVTVFTREEILATGARDLSDLLWLVPGFTQALDVENVVGLGVRGLWSHEGKVLVLVDGLEMTDLLYGANSFGMHLLTSNIERVEIIRGPGSAVYGGHAGMAVISVVTRGPKDLQGGAVELRAGQMSKTFSDRSVGLALGHTFEAKGELGVSVSGTLGQGNRSQGEFIDADGEHVDLSQGGTRTDPAQLVGRVTWRGLTAHALYDNHSLTAIDGYGTVTTRGTGDLAVISPGSQHFETFSADARYRFEPSASLSLEPRVLVTAQRPWFTPDSTDALYYEKTVRRLGGSFTADWAALDTLHLLGGVEAFQSDAFVERPDTLGEGQHTDLSGLSPNRPLHAELQSAAAFLQARWDTSVVNVTAGGRAEWQSMAGLAAVPRLAATRTFGPVTGKLLFSGAFRAPDFENLNLSAGTLRPERLWVAEAEASWQVAPWALVSANGFVVDVDDLILYTVNAETQVQGYLNSSRAVTSGVEAEVQLRGKHGFLRANASYAEANRATTVDAFLAPDTRARLLAMPGLKVALFGHLPLTHGLSLNGSGFWLSQRSGQLWGDALGLAPPVAIVNLNARWDADAATALSGLSCTIGVSNALDSNLAWLQPYAGGHPLLPGRSRDVFVRLVYEHAL